MAKQVLRIGSQGESVKLVQGYLGIAADGIFGLNTEAAVRAFQASHNLLADGVVGANTWSALLEGREPGSPDVRALAGVSAQVIPVGSRLVDSYPFSIGGTAKQAKQLRTCPRPVDGLIGYLGVMNAARLGYVLDEGMGFVGVTLANRFDGKAAVAQAKALGLPAGTSLGLDIEGRKILAGVDWTTIGGAERESHVTQIRGACSAWNQLVKDAGFKTILYVGSPQPLTSKELGDLGFDAYWNALSREADRFGQLAEPSRGYQFWQMFPQHTWPGTDVFVDVNMVGQDFREALPNWVIRG